MRLSRVQLRDGERFCAAVIGQGPEALATIDTRLTLAVIPEARISPSALVLLAALKPLYVRAPEIAGAIVIISARFRQSGANEIYSGVSYEILSRPRGGFARAEYSDISDRALRLRNIVFV